MTKEINIDNWFDENFQDIDKSEHLKSDTNSVSISQIMDAYNESKEQD